MKDRIDRLIPGRNVLAVAALAGSALLLACSGGEEAQKTTTTVAAEASQPTRATTSVVRRIATVTFDDLGGGSDIIRVYRGPGESPNDRVPIGTYRDGQTETADCKVEDGREVPSDPSVGEKARKSRAFVHLPVIDAYATVVYLEDPEKLLARLDPCPS